MESNPHPLPRYRVLADYEVIDPHPLTIAKGVAIEVVRKDDGWPGWVWIKADSQAGWIPETHLTDPDSPETTISLPFNGTELSAKRGEELDAIGSAPGWIFARGDDGKMGWFPLFNLKPVR